MEKYMEYILFLLFKIPSYFILHSKYSSPSKPSSHIPLSTPPKGEGLPWEVNQPKAR